MADTEIILKMARKAGVIRRQDVVARGIHPEHLRRLRAKGLLVRVSRGFYMLPDAEVSEHHSLAEACKRVPHGIVCLLSALRFHDIGTQGPHEVWMAIAPKARRPAPAYPPLRIVRFSGEALSEGVEKRTIDGIPVRITCPARTIADCFKYRNKIGLDVAVEALRDCRQQRKCTMDDLWRYAKLCRVSNVIRPYVEAMA